ncbi:MAG: lipid-binding SYLF domain-containing protein [Planctomycetes bacterium]|nr:lipid-binding SYLF domain-containing protein [Planctomycetota bacterium]
MVRLATLSASLALATLLLSGCSTVPEKKADRDALASACTATISSAKAKDASLETFFKDSYGYAIFPEVGNGGAGLAFSYGHGMVYKGGTVVGYCDLSKGTIGLTLGGQAFAELIFFKDKERYDGFVAGKFVFAANASAVAISAGGGASASYKEGVAVFITDPAGLMFDASIGGQQFNYRSMDSVK